MTPPDSDFTEGDASDCPVTGCPFARPCSAHPEGLGSVAPPSIPPAPLRNKGGRPPGSKNKATIEREALHRERLERVKAEGITPLEFMLAKMREEPPERESDEDAFTYMKRTAEHELRRADMAKAAAPYCHPKLAQIEHSGNMTVRHEDALDELE